MSGQIPIVNPISRKIYCMNKKRRLLLIAGTAASLTTAAGLVHAADTPKGPRLEIVTSKAGHKVNYTALRNTAKGFNTGLEKSPLTVYVFFDAQCGHCAQLWNAHLPLREKASFVWIPVGVLNHASTAQGSTILAAANPEAAMQEHEASISARRGGITANSAAIDKFSAAVAKNTELLRETGVRSVPFIAFKNPKTGETETRTGAMPTPVLASFLGLLG